jgi:hypothetical protein
MDFAFIPEPGKNASILAASQLFHSRIPSSGIVPKAKTNLEDILKWIDTHVPSGQQVSSVFFVSHASDHHVSFLMTPGQKGLSVYTLLVDLQQGSGVSVPSRFTAAVPAGGKSIQIVIKGCRIGSSEIFLLLLKTLLGGQVQVTAPRHYNGMLNISKKGAVVALDTLTYNIEVHLKDPITSHAKLVDAFKAAKFPRYDGSQIPDADIDATLDQLIKPVKKTESTYLPTKTSMKQLKIPFSFLLKFNENIAGRTKHSDDTLCQLRSERVHRTVAQMDDTLFASKPLMDHVDDAAAAWEQKFKKPNLQGGTAEKSFGEHLGLDLGEDLKSLIAWEALKITDPKTGTKGKAIVGTYFRYQLLIPITSVTDGTILFDSERLTGPALANPTTWPSDPNQQAELFRTV